jgi:hypothetical protein
MQRRYEYFQFISATWGDQKSADAELIFQSSGAYRMIIWGMVQRTFITCQTRVRTEIMVRYAL